MLDGTDSFGKLCVELESGGIVMLACDLPGSTPVRFLGRTVTVPSDTARLSLETEAPIIPVSVRRHGSLERLELQAPLATGHTDHRALLQAVFDRRAGAVLDWPEAMERPRQHFAVVDGD